jgi:hypothetical protein
MVWRSGASAAGPFGKRSLPEILAEILGDNPHKLPIIMKAGRINMFSRQETETSNRPTEMKHKLTQTLSVVCLTFAAFCLLSPACRADQPRMDKAIELLQEAKTVKNPVPLLEKAKTHVENATTNKGGRRVAAMRAIDEAIEAANKGARTGPKINKAIELLEEGKEIAR